MDKFGFIVHPVSLQHLYQLSGKFSAVIKRIPPYLVKKFLIKLPPFELISLKNISSRTGKKIEGSIILCPLLPDQIVSLQNKISKEKIIAACMLAQKHGAKIVGLGGFTSIIGDGGEAIRASVDVPVTSGNTYTASLAIDGILNAINVTDMKIHESSIAIVGATGDIGTICVRSLSGLPFQKLILVARDCKRLALLKDSISTEAKAKNIELATDVSLVVKNVQIILTVTSAITTIIRPEDLQPGTILCDVSYPANINMDLAFQRKDVLTFEGGLAVSKCLDNVDISSRYKINLLNPQGAIHGCVAETMLLTFGGRFESFSIGRGKITPQRIEEIRGLALEHGFSCAPFIVGDKIISVQQAKNIGKL